MPEMKCPKCGAKEVGFPLSTPLGNRYECGLVVYHREPAVHSPKCKRRMWKKRAKKAEKEVKRLKAVFLADRARQWNHSGTRGVNEYYAETERLLHGEGDGMS